MRTGEAVESIELGEGACSGVCQRRRETNVSAPEVRSLSNISNVHDIRSAVSFLEVIFLSVYLK